MRTAYTHDQLQPAFDKQELESSLEEGGELPVSAYREQILESVIDNQATIISAETGAGKSTQVPQMIADELDSRVVVTQPRRVAARELAHRVAEERGEEPGESVGYTMSGERQASDQSQIVYSTDGLEALKQLTQEQDRSSVLVLDEVHEWNHNIETLVAWTKQAMQNDPEFRVVVMSATFDAESLARYFGSDSAATFEVPGRTHPVEKHNISCEHKPMEDTVQETILASAADGSTILNFQPGKREIEETVERLQKQGLDATHDIVPLHGQQDRSEQSKAFSKNGRPKIIVSTNVAQTSVTVPGVDVVVDTGLERRTEVNDGVEGLYLRPISQADCQQRAGRAGREKPGSYILIGEPLENRPDEPLPEIRRTRIESALLRLASTGIDARETPLYHQPTEAELEHAYTTLHAIGALDNEGDVTRIGQEIDRLPIEASAGRSLIEAREYGVESEVAAILAIWETGSITDRHNTDWQTLVAGSSSDAAASLKLLQASRDKTAAELRSMGLHAKQARRALQHVRTIEKALGKHSGDWTEANITPELETAITRSLLAGRPDKLYINRGGSLYNANSTDSVREFERDSIAQRTSQVYLGEPFDLQIKTKRGMQTLRLLTNNVPVALEDLRATHPDLLQEETATTTYDPQTDTTHIQTGIYLHETFLENTFKQVEVGPEHTQARDEYYHQQQWQELQKVDPAAQEASPDKATPIEYGRQPSTGQPFTAYAVREPRYSLNYNSARHTKTVYYDSSEQAERAVAQNQRNYEAWRQQQEQREQRALETDKRKMEVMDDINRLHQQLATAESLAAADEELRSRIEGLLLHSPLQQSRLSHQEWKARFRDVANTLERSIETARTEAEAARRQAEERAEEEQRQRKAATADDLAALKARFG